MMLLSPSIPVNFSSKHDLEVEVSQLVASDLVTEFQDTAVYLCIADERELEVITHFLEKENIDYQTLAPPPHVLLRPNLKVALIRVSTESNEVVGATVITVDSK